MKILLLGYYDYAFGYSACVLENNELKPVQLTQQEYDMIYYRDFLKDESSIAEYERIKKELFSQYDMVIVCDDGMYYLVKGTSKDE